MIILKNRLILIMILCCLILFVASGCGTTGGSGRYTIPPEIPTTTIEDPDDYDPDSLLASAWEDFRLGSYNTSIEKFNQVLRMSNATNSHKTSAYNGMGWSLSRYSGIETAYMAFSQAAGSSNEARIGLAAALINRGQMQDFLRAINLLEEVGLENPAYTFRANNPIGLSNAEAHAMLALCYFWRNSQGDHEKAKVQINTAISEDASSDGSVAQIYNSLKKLGLSGI